jgi:hypothetical protein
MRSGVVLTGIDFRSRPGLRDVQEGSRTVAASLEFAQSFLRKNQRCSMSRLKFS